MKNKLRQELEAMLGLHTGDSFTADNVHTLVNGIFAADEGGGFEYVEYDNDAFPYPQEIGSTAPSINGLGPANENMIETIFIMPNKSTNPDATLMIVVDEVTPETNPKTYQYVYVGNINDLPSDVLTEGSIVNDLSTGGTDKPLSAEQGRTLNSHVNYTTCESGAADEVKLIPDSGFELSTHLRLLVKMNNTNTNATPKFNINNTGIKDVWYNGSVASDINTWSASEVLDVYYDGTKYIANTHSGAQFSTGEKVSDIGIDDEPTAGSNNLVKSGGVHSRFSQLDQELNGKSAVNLSYTLATIQGSTFSQYENVTLEEDREFEISSDLNTVNALTVYFFDSNGTSKNVYVNGAATNPKTSIDLISGASSKTIKTSYGRVEKIRFRSGGSDVTFSGNTSAAITSDAVSGIVMDSLESTATDKALSAKQGKVLDEKITEAKGGIDSLDEEVNGSESIADELTLTMVSDKNYNVTHNVVLSPNRTFVVGSGLEHSSSVTLYFFDGEGNSVNVSIDGISINSTFTITSTKNNRIIRTLDDAVSKITVVVLKANLTDGNTSLTIDSNATGGLVGSTRVALANAGEGYAVNPFVDNPFYYHYAANGFLRGYVGNTVRNLIASESLEDVEIASRLGFKFIEINVHKTADITPTFVCIHGTNGKFGTSVKLSPNHTDQSLTSDRDVQNTTISEVTLEWIKNNIIFGSFLDKYKTTVPSLDEFCQVCKKKNIGVFCGLNAISSNTDKKTAFEICRKYMGNNMIVYSPPADIREYFAGYVFNYYSTSGITKDAIIANANLFGTPFMIGLSQTVASQLEASNNLDLLIKEAHQKGYVIGSAYATDGEGEASERTHFSKGFDFYAASHEVNQFESNYQIYDIDDLTNIPTIPQGSLVNGVVTLNVNDVLTCGNSDKIALGKGSLVIRFDGDLKISFGSVGERTSVVSDGESYIVITDYFLRNATYLEIEANENTTVYEFVYKTSRC